MGNTFDPAQIKLDGWKPDPTNNQYLKFDKTNLQIDNIKSNRVISDNINNIDLRQYSSPRHNQGATSTCVAQSIIKALEIKRIIQHGKEAHVSLSVLDLYYGARERMTPSMVEWDSGTHIYLACNVLKDLGVCSDKIHSWETNDVYKKPSIMASREARLNRIKTSFKIQSTGQERLNDIIFNLKAHNPVVFGTTVGSDWMNYTGGKKPLKIETKPKGKHAMCCVGYVDGLFIIENSWGNQWGIDGFGFVDPSVLIDENTQDLWVIVDGSEAWTEK